MPTIKQKIAFKEVLKGMSIKDAMIKANYSPKTALNSGKLTRTDGWNQLMEKHLPDNILAKKHNQLLNKTEKIVVGVGKGFSEIQDTGQPHSDAVKALDLAYKLKSRYPAPDEAVGNKVMIINITAEASQKYGIRAQNFISQEND